MKHTLITVTILIVSLAHPSHGGINEWSLSLQTPSYEWGETGFVAIDPTDRAALWTTPAETLGLRWGCHSTDR